MAVIALATCATHPDLTESDRLYAEALSTFGTVTHAAPWQSGVDPFRTADLVVIRSAWDYHRDIAAYRRWLDGLEAASLQVANPTSLVRWNLEKSYLEDLAAAGVPAPAQHIVRCDLDAVRAVLDGTDWSQAVVKPSVGASGHGVHLVTPRTLDQSWPEIEAAASPHRIVVQEFVPEIREHGQISFVFLGGRFSHAMRFVPAGGDFRINARFAPTLEQTTPAPDDVAQAAHVLTTLPARPLYARIDMVRQDGRLLLLEAEVNEPGLLFQYVPEAAQTFAEATMDWLGISRNPDEFS